jgi:hypothetical protein
MQIVSIADEIVFYVINVGDELTQTVFLIFFFILKQWRRSGNCLKAFESCRSLFVPNRLLVLTSFTEHDYDNFKMRVDFI